MFVFLVTSFVPFVITSDFVFLSTVYLAGHRRHAEAASVLIEYANDTEEAVSVLIDGGHWEEALRLVSQYHMINN